MLKKTVLVHTLSLAFGGAMLGMAAMSPAMAQSNASGSVYGKVAGGTGDTVTLVNSGTNARVSAVLRSRFWQARVSKRVSRLQWQAAFNRSG